jgi:hypothetical protein
VENHLAFIDGPFVEHLGRDVFRGKVDALAASLFEHGRKEAHLKFKGQHVNA